MRGDQEAVAVDLAAADGLLVALVQRELQRLLPGAHAIDGVRQHVHRAARQGGDHRAVGSAELGGRPRRAIAGQHDQQVGLGVDRGAQAARRVRAVSGAQTCAAQAAVRQDLLDLGGRSLADAARGDVGHDFDRA